MPTPLALFESVALRPISRRAEAVSPLPHLVRRIFLISMIAWFPLLVLSLVGGQAVSGAAMPFFRDFEAQARLLIALPLMLLAGRFCDAILMPTLRVFFEEGIVQEKDRARFDRIIASTVHWSRSPLLLVILMAIAVAASHNFTQRTLMSHPDTWYGQATDAGHRWTYAGYWYSWIATPLFQFVQFGWYLRLLL